MNDERTPEATDLVGRFDPEQDLPEAMRADVRLLGGMLGQVLRESGSPGLYDDVERLRQAALLSHDDDPVVAADSFAEAERVVASFTAERADEVARAFTAYFHLVNLAEEHQRVRMLRRRDGRPDPDDPADSVVAAFQRLTHEVGRDEALDRLKGLRFQPVFTAHPTEARRRAVSASIRRIAALLSDRDAALPGGSEERRARRRILEEVDTLWRTAPLRVEKPSPTDEVHSVMGIFDDTLYTAIPHVYRRIDDAIQGAGAGRQPPLVRPFVRLGSWVGGDRDGNPYVTPAVTRSAVAIASEHVLRGLERTAERVGRALTLDADGTPPSDALLSLWHRLRSPDEAAAAEIAKRSPNEPHRRIMLLIARRIAATRTRNADLAYRDPEELLEHLRVVQESLARAGAERHAYGMLQHLVWQVETYGFHLAELEVRQHSQVHARVLAEIDAGGPLSDTAEEVLEVFRVIAFLQERYGVHAAGRYIVSFTQSVDDIAAVFALSRHAVGAAGHPPVLDVIPLFETYDDLRSSVGILDGAIALPEFAARLDATGRHVEVMLGYSDSSKDVGPVAATLALYDAQAEITAWGHERGIHLTLFHGRGGALGRGGGPANKAILAQPPHSVHGRFKLTEQGEVIFARYGDKDVAMRHIDLVAAATLLASAPSIENRNRAAAESFASMAEVLESASRKRFDELVHAPGFAPWFATVTPMEEIGGLALGSRPARRGLSVESLEDLRAIPWVFAWSQARINLAGWYGLGTALEAVGDADRLRAAYEQWPLFRTMIDNAAMSLVKADGRIAVEYLALGDRDDLAALVLEELELTRRWVAVTTGGIELMDNRPVLQRALRLRSPYIDALSLLQLRALRALRAGGSGPESERDRRLLLLSVSGVSAGLQNTG